MLELCLDFADDVDEVEAEVVLGLVALDTVLAVVTVSAPVIGLRVVALPVILGTAADATLASTEADNGKVGGTLYSPLSSGGGSSGIDANRANSGRKSLNIPLPSTVEVIVLQGSEAKARAVDKRYSLSPLQTS
jgi:hypothetical protein